MDSIPDNIVVDPEVAMDEMMTRTAHIVPADLRRTRDEIRIVSSNPGCRLAHCREAHGNGMLGLDVGKKLVARLRTDELQGSSRRAFDMFQIIIQPKLVHTGRTSAMTFARNFSGSSCGVRTSTTTPNSFVNSSVSPPRSNN